MFESQNQSPEPRLISIGAVAKGLARDLRAAGVVISAETEERMVWADSLDALRDMVADLGYAFEFEWDRK